MTRTQEQIADDLRPLILEMYQAAAEQDDYPLPAAPSVTGWVFSAAITGFNEDGEVVEDGHVALDGSHRLAKGLALDALDYLRGGREEDL